MSINHKFIWSVAALALGMPVFASGQTATTDKASSPGVTQSMVSANTPIEIQSSSKDRKANKVRISHDKNFKLRVARLEHLRDLALRHEDKTRASKLDRIIQRLHENHAKRRAAIRDRTRDHVAAVKDRVSDHRDQVQSARAERRANRIERAATARARLSHREAQQRNMESRRHAVVKHAHARLEHDATAGRVRHAVTRHRQAVDRRVDRRRDHKADRRRHAQDRNSAARDRADSARDQAHKVRRQGTDQAANPGVKRD